VALKILQIEAWTKTEGKKERHQRNFKTQIKEAIKKLKKRLDL
jgi:hypothetical protein